jgi:hypothetical protein
MGERDEEGVQSEAQKDDRENAKPSDGPSDDEEMADKQSADSFPSSDPPSW